MEFRPEQYVLPWFAVDEIPEDIQRVVLALAAYHDARSEGDHELAESILAAIDADPTRFHPELVEAMEEARRLSIQSPQTDQAQ